MTVDKICSVLRCHLMYNITNGDNHQIHFCAIRPRSPFFSPLTRLTFLSLICRTHFFSLEFPPSHAPFVSFVGMFVKHSLGDNLLERHIFVLYFFLFCLHVQCCRWKTMVINPKCMWGCRMANANNNDKNTGYCKRSQQNCKFMPVTKTHANVLDNGYDDTSATIDEVYYLLGIELMKFISNN